jgi:hypothetical protein
MDDTIIFPFEEESGDKNSNIIQDEGRVRGQK